MYWNIKLPNGKKKNHMRKRSNKEREFLWLTTFPQEECIESKARSSTYKSTALSSGRVDVKLKPKSMRTWKEIEVADYCRLTIILKESVKCDGATSFSSPPYQSPEMEKQ